MDESSLSIGRVDRHAMRFVTVLLFKIHIYLDIAFSSMLTEIHAVCIV